MIEAGKLRHRITLMAPSSSQLANGEDVEVWESVGSFWAAIMPLTAKQTEQERQVTSTATHQILMRWTPVAAMGCRIQYGASVIESFAGFDSTDFSNCDSTAFAALPSQSKSPRIFSINSLKDMDERRRELRLTVTEIQ